MAVLTKTLPNAAQISDQMPKLPIVVWTPQFDENGGGCIVLHALAFKLGQLGATVYAGTHRSKQFAALPTATPSMARRLKNRLRLANQRRLARLRLETEPSSLDAVKCHPSMPLVQLGDFDAQQPFIAIYPEIVSGNPFKAKHVVRWLLHKPGFFLPDIKFGAHEYTFFYQPAFAENVVGVDPDNLLRIHWMRDDVYVNRNLPNRRGKCRMIRKGHVDAGLLAMDDAILLDGKSHQEIADIFNRTERFYCHDPYTLFVYYAALCGCTPIVVPQPGLERDAWRAGYELKHGVAYGEDEIDWAIATRDQLFADQAKVAQAETAALQGFLAKLATRFPE